MSDSAELLQPAERLKGFEKGKSGEVMGRRFVVPLLRGTNESATLFIRPPPYGFDFPDYRLNAWSMKDGFEDEWPFPADRL